MVDVVEQALAKAKLPAIAALERWRLEMPTEDEMEAKDKYTVFDPKERKYRKAIHSEQPRPRHWNLRWKLTGHRGAKVDESFAENQPTRILKLGSRSWVLLEFYEGFFDDMYDRGQGGVERACQAHLRIYLYLRVSERSMSSSNCARRCHREANNRTHTISRLERRSPDCQSFSTH